jgi:hypothetical protein
MEHMKTKLVGLPLAFCLVAGSACLAADPLIGTWKLNEAKSKFSPGQTKNTTVIYQTVGDKVKVSVEGVDAKGKPTHNEWTGKFDGRDYPVSGDPTANARAYKRVNDRTLEMTVTRGGRTVSKGRLVVSPDGKTRTVTVSGTDPKGNHFKNTAVYDKQ